MTRELALALGRAARQARSARDLTQEKVAERLEVSVEFYARIERGTARPSLEVFARMVSVLAVSADVLLGLERDAGMGPPEAQVISPELDELVAMLRRARPGTLRLVAHLIRELEQIEAARHHAAGGSRTVAAQLPAASEDE